MALAATIFAGSRPACLRLTSSAHQKCFMPRRSLFVPRCRWSGINPYPLQLNDSAATTVAAASTGCSVQEELMIQGMTTFLDKLKYNSDGLVAVIVQHVDTGEVLMQAYADRAALSETLQTRLATFYSRSRKGRWCKGETSGHFINVQQVFVDCDSDSIIYLGEPVGPACHTGARALVATLTGMFFANIGVVPAGAPEYSVVNKFLLPLAIPMLLFAADLRRVVSDTGRLLGAFFIGAFATVLGSVVAMYVLPMDALGGEGWKIAAALMARHIGGAVNYVAVSEALEISPSATGAGLAADDLILAIYFSTIYGLAKGIPPEAGAISSDTANPGHGTSYAGKTITVYEGICAVAVSALVCCLAAAIAKALHLPGQFITIVTAITVMAASVIPHKLAPLVRSGEGLAQMLMQVFFATVGASARIAETFRTGPTLFAFSAIALAIHLLVIFAVGRLVGYSRQDLLLASNANIGGPSTVAGMAAAKGWPSRLVPAVLTSTMGYALGTFTGMVLGYTVLKPMDGAATLLSI